MEPSKNCREIAAIFHKQFQIVVGYKIRTVAVIGLVNDPFEKALIFLVRGRPVDGDEVIMLISKLCCY